MAEETKTGRPKKYNTVEEMEKVIEQYFEERKREGLPYTVSGLALALDMTRETLLKYEENSEFSDTIKRAKQRIEEYVETRLFVSGIATGVIFNLKNNFGWKDKQEIEQSGGLSNTVNVDFSHLSVEQIKELLKNEDKG
jgi:hypothetical protein